MTRTRPASPGAPPTKESMRWTSLTVVVAATALSHSPHTARATPPRGHAPASPDTRVLNLAYFDWSSVDQPLTSTTPPRVWGVANFTQGLSATFLVAAEHFNERRVDVLPDLGRVVASGCNKNVSVVVFCETAGNARRSAGDTMWALNNFPVDAVVGYGGIDELMAGGLVAQEFDDLPIISHWVTSPRSYDSTVFRTFARTTPSDFAGADKTVALLGQLQYARVAMLYLSPDGAEFAKYLAFRAAGRNISVTATSFKYGVANSDDVDASVKIVAASGLRVVVCATWAFLLPQIAAAAEKYGMLDDDERLFIFTYMGDAPGAAAFSDFPTLRRLMHGSLFVHIAANTDQDSNWSRFKSNFPDSARHLAKMNALLPPHGAGNDSQRCRDYSLQYQLPADFFTPSNAALGNAVWGYAYDAVMTLGFASCALDPTGPAVPRGEALYREALRVDFRGMSRTRVRFDPATGDRDSDTAGFSLTNFALQSDGSMLIRVVGEFDVASSSFRVNDSTVTWRSNATGVDRRPPDVIRPLENRNYLPRWAKSLGYAEVALVQATAAATLVSLVAWRKDVVVVNGQPALLHLTWLGCAIASWAIFALTVDDDPSDAYAAHASEACMAAPALFSFGVSLALASLTAKTYRVYKLFVNRKLRVVRFRVGKALALVVVTLGVVVAVLAAWIARAPLFWLRTVNFYDGQGFPLASAGTCAGTDETLGFAVAVASLFALALVCAAVAAHAVRNVPDEYQESRWIALVLLFVAEIYIVAVPTVVAVWPVGGAGRFMLLSTIVFVNTELVLVLVFAPKVFAVVTKSDLWARVMGASASATDPTAAVSVGGPHDEMIRGSGRLRVQSGAIGSGITVRGASSLGRSASQRVAVAIVSSSTAASSPSLPRPHPGVAATRPVIGLLAAESAAESTTSSAQGGGTSVAVSVDSVLPTTRKGSGDAGPT